MKKEMVQVVFLALVIMLPLAFTSILQLSNSKAICELAEIPSEEEQKGEQEAEGEDTINEFLIHTVFNVLVAEVKSLQFLEKRASINSTIREILTPPPELS